MEQLGISLLTVVSVYGTITKNDIMTSHTWRYNYDVTDRPNDVMLGKTTFENTVAPKRENVKSPDRTIDTQNVP